jgi:peptidoglycan/LPS O-acetylase OafA/YrhL
MSELKIELPAPIRGRLQILDEYKGFAIIMVVLYHVCGVLNLPNWLHGDLGVDIFVILSGLGLALSSKTEPAAVFFRNRLLRIFPTYWLVLTVYVLCNNHFLQHNYTATNIILHYTGFHGLFGDGYALSINDSFWFITLLVTLYLVFVAVRGLRDDMGRLLFVSAAFSWAFAYAMLVSERPGSFGHLALRVPGFFAGFVIGQLLREGRLTIKLGWPFCVAVLLFCYLPFLQGFTFLSPVVALAVMGGYLFLWKRFAPAGVETRVNRVLVFAGNHSLEIFLIHQPLIREYNHYLHGRWFNIPAPGTFSLIVGILAGLALTLFLSVELKPLIARLLPQGKPTA